MLAATPTDFGKTLVVINNIRTYDAKPLKHKLRSIHFTRRQYLEHKIEKLLEVGAILFADPGACPYASKTVVSPKMNGTLSMFVDNRDLNAPTDKDAFVCNESTQSG